MKLLGNKVINHQRMIAILLGIIFSILALELGLRLGGVLFISFQEYSNRISLYKKGTYRIMCLGESTTAVGGKDSYPSQLEDILNQRSIGIKFNVINKGVPLVDTSYILAHLEENLNQCKPDLVTAMMGSNDVTIKYYEDIPEARTILFNRLSSYRFLRILWMNMVNKIRKIGIYKPEEESKATPLDSNIATAELKWQMEKLEGPDARSDMAYLELGRRYGERGELVQAEKTVKKAIELNPKNDTAYVLLGAIYRCQGKQAQSEVLFKKALEINPKNNEAYFELARCYCNQEKFIKAEEIYKKAIEVNPQKDEAYVDLGQFYRDNFKKPAEAEQSFKKAIELNPQNHKAYLELGRCCMYYGKFTQAVQAFKKAIALEPGDPSAITGFVSLYSEMGKDKLAEEYYRKAKQLKSGDYSLMTAHNYQKLKMTLDKKGIKLVCVQYPMRSIDSLKMLLQGQDGVIFVDNEKVFKNALKKGSFKDYFIDMFAGDFGHCTEKGNRLLAENIANVILREVFHK